MTACWDLEHLFWPFVKIEGYLDLNLGVNISGNIFDHEDDNLRIILSPGL